MTKVLSAAISVAPLLVIGLAMDAAHHLPTQHTTVRVASQARASLPGGGTTVTPSPSSSIASPPTTGVGSELAVRPAKPPASPAPGVTAPRKPAPAAVTVQAHPAVETGFGCTAALAYLRSHAAPGFVLECPGNALGHQAMTCVNIPGICFGLRIIAIADPCPAAYMNEASNSWVLTKLRHGRIDPYGFCS
jgi:hypothetical protein